MTILNIIYIVCAVLLLFGAAIFFHELGHYWVALKLGMKVEEFAIGMGPKIYSWKRNGIVYSIRWIPAGGFVKLPQMITSEALEGQADSKVPPAPPFHKILVAVAGPCMNVIFGFVVATLIYFVGLPTPVNPPIIGEVEVNSPEGKMGIKEGDRILMVNNQSINSWQDITFATITAQTNVLPVVIQHGKETNTYLLTTVASPIGGKYLNLDSLDHPVIGAVESDMPAAKVDIKPGDKIFAVNGIPTGSSDRMMEVISNKAGAPCEITFMRKGEKRTVTITPKMRPDANSRARIGVSFSPLCKSEASIALGPNQRGHAENFWHHFGVDSQQKNRCESKRSQRAGGNSFDSGRKRISGLSPRLELSGVVEHQPGHHQYASHTRP